jgi:hypothetical protein
MVAKLAFPISEPVQVLVNIPVVVPVGIAVLRSTRRVVSHAEGRECIWFLRILVRAAVLEVRAEIEGSQE